LVDLEKEKRVRLTFEIVDERLLWNCG
jgi:hypothetical protein